MSSESSAEAMSERELEAFEQRAFGWSKQRRTNRAADEYSVDVPNLVAQLRRSHTEAAELRERVEELVGALREVGYTLEVLGGAISGRPLVKSAYALIMSTLSSKANAHAKLETRSEEEESMSKAYFERTESDKRHRVTIRLIEVGRNNATVEVTTNATSGELACNPTPHSRYTMQIGTPQQGFTVVVED